VAAWNPSADNNTDDRALVESCRSGDESAWRSLVDRHTRRVFRIAYQFTGRADDAEDLTQEIFVRVMKAIDRFDASQGAFGAWLTTLARRQAIDHYRRRRQERIRRVEEPTILDLAEAESEAPLQRLEREERVRLVHSGLRALPQDLRDVLVLCDLQELGYDEISRTLEIPLGTVKSRINRGRLELAKRLLARRQMAAVGRTGGA
jgi:RNA polymerase sigma-70 factor (ECF subfamily)